AHSNVAFMFDEEERRERDDDTLTVYRGLLGSYPNFFFDVPLAQLQDFTDALHGASTEAQYRDIVARYGVARMDPAIWDNFQWHVDYMRQSQPLAAGVYDLSRYKKVSDLMSDEEP
ncbi:MAG: fatty acid cis/trans isomerase, partial [Halieaceae bacterium]|nr:fatty acid cis/trans isomerase [Halieaceae bacterium]